MNQSHTNREERRGVARRTFLRGVGVTMALPWLESLTGFKRAGASGILTYFALEAARLLKQKLLA